MRGSGSLSKPAAATRHSEPHIAHKSGCVAGCGEKPQHKRIPTHWGPQTAQPMNLQEGTKSSRLPPGSKDSKPPSLPVADGPGKQVSTWSKASPRPGGGTPSELAEPQPRRPKIGFFPSLSQARTWVVGGKQRVRAARSEPTRAPARGALTPACPARATLLGLASSR